MTGEHKIGFTCGAFDLLHAGHVMMLKEARQQCDYLTVGLHTDPSIDRPEKNKPIQSVYERYKQLEAVRWVDRIIPYETENDLLVLLYNEDIDVRILGDEYKEKDYTGSELVDVKMAVYYNTRQHPFSSSSLRRRLEESEKEN